MNRLMREVKDLLGEVAGSSGRHEHRAWAEKLLARPPFAGKTKAPGKTLPEKTRRQAKKEKGAVHSGRTARVRAAAWLRSEGFCECNCGCPLTADEGELDHFFGGHRRRALTTESNCWRLAPHCHRAKTENRPSRAWWLLRFGEHRQRHGYDALPHKERAP